MNFRSILCLLAFSLAGSLSPAWAQEKVQGVHGEALLRRWVQPEFPAEARRQKLAGTVVVDFIVDAEGRVTAAKIARSSAAMFEEPALAAVRQWTFSPGLEDDRPVTCGMTVQIEFPLAQLKQKVPPTMPPGAPHLQPHGSRTSPVRPIDVPDPAYPDELEERRLPGEVRLEFEVTAEGRVQAPRVLWASHPAFVEESLRAAERSRFEPARQGLLPKATTIRYPVSFRSFGAKRADLLAASGVQVATPVDVLPEPIVLTEPAYPHDLLLRRTEGFAVVSFTVDANGYATAAQEEEASAPDFGAALRAAVETWLFKPARHQGERVAARLTVRHEFKVPTEGPLWRLLNAVNAGPLGTADGLDSPLQPLWRGFPTYPTQLLDEKLQGSATIEFIVDRGGRARLPRVVSATRPEFGWAAAMAVSQWVFERPKRDGVPTEVRVQVPIGFKPPA